MSDQLMSKTQQYSVSISPVLQNKLNHHLHLLQTLLGLQHQKRDWYIAAIEEKLARDTNESKVEKEKRIGFRLDQLTKKKLEDHIQNEKGRAMRSCDSIKHQAVLSSFFESQERKALYFRIAR